MKRKLVFVVFFLLLMAVMPALAHEHREVGLYILTFGWREEPALTGQRNGPELFVNEGEQPVEGAELQVEVTFGPATVTLDMRQAFGEPGHYIADMIPTRPGDYSFRVIGTIGETAIDETFTSADGEFSSVEPVSDVHFPDAEPSLFDLLARIEALEAEVAELRQAMEQNE